MSGSRQIESSGRDQYQPPFDNAQGSSAYVDDNPFMPSWSSGFEHQYAMGSQSAFPTAGDAYNDGFGAGNPYAAQQSAYQASPLTYDPEFTIDPASMTADEPSYFDDAFGIDESGYNMGSQATNLQLQANIPQMSPYVYPQVLPDQGVIPGMAGTYSAQLPSNYQIDRKDEVSPNDEDGLFEEEGDELPAESEDESSAEYQEGDDLDTDNGEFVVTDTRGKSNIEKPGIIREDNGYLEWRDNHQTWHRAVAHHNIRAALIREAQAAYPGATYDHPDEAGLGPHDVTAFHVSYQHWGPAREDRPVILFQFDAPNVRAPVARPGYMKFRGMIVLNHQNNPVLDWPIPATLSSKTSGANMEAWKRTLGLGQEDMRARMVRYTIKDVNGARSKLPLPDKNVVINMPMQRFRDRAGCVSWTKRQSSSTLRDGILALMRSHGFDPVLANSIEGFGRDLTVQEQQEVKKGSKGKFLHKAGKRRLPDDVRRQREDKEKSKSNKRTAPAVAGPSTAENRRKRTLPPNASPDESDEEEIPRESSRILRSRKRIRVVEDPDAEGETDDGADDDWASQRDNFTDARTSTHLVQHMQARLWAQPKSRTPRGMNDVEQTTDQREDTSATKYVNQPEMAYDENNMGATSSHGTRPLPGPIQPSQSGPNSREARIARHVENFSNNPNFQRLQAYRRTFEEFEADVETRGSDSVEPARKRQAVAERPQRTATYAQQSQNLNPEVRRSRHIPGQRGLAQSTPNRVARAPIGVPRTNDVANALTTSSAENSARPQAPAPQIDCRTLPPRTESERLSIEAALQATREAYFEYTGYPAPTTNRNRSYDSQWRSIRASFEEFDWSEEPDGQAPYFPHLPPWYTTIEQWPPHPKDSMYYEAWKRGFRAPRGPHGELIDLPGGFLENIGRLDDGERQLFLDRAVGAKGYAPQGLGNGGL